MLYTRGRMVWTTVWLLLILKIPVAYLGVGDLVGREGSASAAAGEPRACASRATVSTRPDRASPAGSSRGLAIQARTAHRRAAAPRIALAQGRRRSGGDGERPRARRRTSPHATPSPGSWLRSSTSPPRSRSSTTGRLGTLRRVVALIAAAIGSRPNRLVGSAVVAATLWWLAGMTIAVALERPIF